MGAEKRWYWEIRNSYGLRVATRSTLRDCLEILDKYATEPPTYEGWKTGPYTVWRMSEEKRVTHQPRINVRREEGIHRESDDLHRPSKPVADWYGRHEG